MHKENDFAFLFQHKYYVIDNYFAEIAVTITRSL